MLYEGQAFWGPWWLSASYDECLTDMKSAFHDPEVMFSNLGRVEQGVHSSSVLVGLEPKI